MERTSLKINLSRLSFGTNCTLEIITQLKLFRGKKWILLFAEIHNHFLNSCFAFFRAEGSLDSHQLQVTLVFIHMKYLPVDLWQQSSGSLTIWLKWQPNVASYLIAQQMELFFNSIFFEIIRLLEDYAEWLQNPL